MTPEVAHFRRPPLAQNQWRTIGKTRSVKPVSAIEFCLRKKASMAEANNENWCIGGAMAKTAMLQPLARVVPHPPLPAIGPRSRLTAPLGQSRFAHFSASPHGNPSGQRDCPPVRCHRSNAAGSIATETSSTMQAIDHKPAKPPRIGKKIRQAVELMLSGQCASQKAVCERLGISESYLSRSLKKDNIQAFITRATAKTIATGKLAATSTALRLVQGAKSEHVQLQASEFILGLNGMHANPSAPGVNINVGAAGGIGYLVVLAKPTDEVLEGEVTDAGGVQYGRMMTPDERRTGQLIPQHPGHMVDITPTAAETSSAEPKRIRGGFER